MVKKFQRKIEDFVCEYCGYEVAGNGYTNHCPKCLYSKHVDINPGDRQASCGGLMEPVELMLDHGGYVIMHRCVICGHTKRNHAGKEDDAEALRQLSSYNKS